MALETVCDAGMHTRPIVRCKEHYASPTAFSVPKHAECGKSQFRGGPGFGPLAQQCCFIAFRHMLFLSLKGD
jgi:hypothetical protein